MSVTSKLSHIVGVCIGLATTLTAVPLDDFIKRSETAATSSESRVDELLAHYRGQSENLLNEIATRIFERRSPEAMPAYVLAWEAVRDMDPVKAKIAARCFRKSDALNAGWTANLLRWTDRTSITKDASPGLSLYSDYIQQEDGSIDLRLAAYCIKASPRQAIRLFAKHTTASESAVSRIEAKVDAYRMTSSISVDKRREIFSDIEKDLRSLLAHDDWFVGAYAANVLERIRLTGTEIGVSLRAKNSAFTNFFLMSSGEPDFGKIGTIAAESASGRQVEPGTLATQSRTEAPKPTGLETAGPVGTANQITTPSPSATMKAGSSSSFLILPVAIAGALIVGIVIYLLRRKSS